MSLFHLAAPEEPVFQKVLNRFFGVVPDYLTLEALENLGCGETYET